MTEDELNSQNLLGIAFELQYNHTLVLPMKEATQLINLLSQAVVITGLRYGEAKLERKGAKFTAEPLTQTKYKLLRQAAVTGVTYSDLIKSMEEDDEVSS